DKPERLRVASEVLTRANPITFAVQALKWFHPSEETPEAERIFTLDEINQLKKAFANQVQLYFHEAGLAVVESGNQQYASLLLLWAWHGVPGEAKGFVTDALSKEARLAVPLLKAFAPISLSVSGTSVGPFERRNYDALTTVVDGAHVREALQTTFAGELESSSYMRDRNVPEER